MLREALPAPLPPPLPPGLLSAGPRYGGVSVPGHFCRALGARGGGLRARRAENARFVFVQETLTSRTWDQFFH